MEKMIAFAGRSVRVLRIDVRISTYWGKGIGL